MGFVKWLARTDDFVNLTQNLQTETHLMAAITHAHSGVMPNRPHDYIYDSTFTVSSHKDHVKQMTRSQAQQVVRLFTLHLNSQI